MFKMKARDFYRVMVEFDLLSFPRAVGNPYQDIVYNPQGMWNFVKVNGGARICFTSHNSYPKWDGMIDPVYIRLGKFFFDFDHKTKLENPLGDAKKLASFMDSESLPWGSIFSGKKGFHDYLFLKRTNRKITHSLWDKVIAVHSWLRYKGDKGRIPIYEYDKKKREIIVKRKGRPWLPTLDPKVAEPKRLCRIPFTRHVTMGDERKYIVSKSYCIPLKPETLYEAGIDQIKKLSNNPIMNNGYITEGKRMSLNEFIEHFDIDVKYWSSIGKEEETKGGGFIPTNYEGVPDDDFAIYISKLITRPCIHADLFSTNPSHFTRMQAVITLKKQGWEIGEIIELFDKIAESFKWADIQNRGRRVYQIRHIFFKKTAIGGYEIANHQTIKNKGLCVGKKCPEWIDTRRRKNDS